MMFQKHLDLILALHFNKKIFKFLIFFFILIHPTLLNAKENIVFIDLNYVLNKSNEGKKILNELNILNEKNKKQFSNTENSLEKERDNIKKLKNIITNEEYNKKVSLFQDKVEIYNKEKTEIIKSFENRKKKELDIFFKNLNNIMNTYMKENSIDMILDKKNVVMSLVKNDISNKIVDLINK